MDNRMKNEKKSLQRVAEASDSHHTQKNEKLTQKQNATSGNRPPTLREKLLKRKHGRVHPAAVDDYLPIDRMMISKTNQKDAYGPLTDNSTYSDYAWAFLRRNRFYQQLLDKSLTKHDIQYWGYRSSKATNHHLGLVDAKPYKELPGTGTKIRWWGIHSFLDQLEARAIHGKDTVEIEWPATQVALIFDIDPVFGDGTTAINLQIELAKRHLHNSVGTKLPILKKPRRPDKWLLRAQLRVADLLSSPTKICIAKQVRQRK